ncbi:MAG: nitroreductase family protein [Spirochaetes bacterium]|nr:nitroreductase family protein [Spirochaetota bacterium]
MNYEDFLSLCKIRRSVRQYNDKKVLIGDIYKIIDAAIQAPSGTNIQGWKFRIINNKNEIIKVTDIIEQKLKDVASKFDDSYILKENFLKYGKNFYFFKKAPCVIFLYSCKPRNIVKRFFGKGLSWYKGEGVFLSLGMAMQNMMLAACTLGISTCALTGPLLAEKELNDILKPPPKHELTALLCLGYTDKQPQSPGRKPIEKFIVK